MRFTNMSDAIARAAILTAGVTMTLAPFGHVVAVFAGMTVGVVSLYISWEDR